MRTSRGTGGVTGSAGIAGGIAHSATGKGVARNTAIFSIGTGISRVVGLLREIVAPVTLARAARPPPSRSPPGAESGGATVRQRCLVGGVRAGVHRPAPAGSPQRGGAAGFDAVLDHADRPGCDLGFFIFAARAIMPLFIGPTFRPALVDLTVGLSQVLFPVVLLLGLTGLLTGILQSMTNSRFPAISPAVWNS